MDAGLFIHSLSTDPAYFFARVITVVISITLHELAHGYAALKLGDDTPYHTGHMTLDPLVHMGKMSLLLLAVVGIAFGAMPIDPTRLRGKYAEAIVAAAGPATNLVLGLLALTAVALWDRFDATPFEAWSPASANGRYLLVVFGTTNLILTLFNLIPLPPLDGYWIASNVSRRYRRLLSSELAYGVAQGVLFGVFLGAGILLQPLTDKATTRFVKAVSGKPAYRVEVVRGRWTITHPEAAYSWQQAERELGPDVDAEFYGMIKRISRDEPDRLPAQD